MHNLPTRIDDAGLKQIFYSLLKQAGKEASNAVGSGEQVDEDEVVMEQEQQDPELRGTGDEPKKTSGDGEDNKPAVDCG